MLKSRVRSSLFAAASVQADPMGTCCSRGQGDTTSSIEAVSAIRVLARHTAPSGPYAASKLMPSDGSSADLSDADRLGADVRGADLSGVDLCETDLGTA